MVGYNSGDKGFHSGWIISEMSYNVHQKWSENAKK